MPLKCVPAAYCKKSYVSNCTVCIDIHMIVFFVKMKTNQRFPLLLIKQCNKNTHSAYFLFAKGETATSN